MAAAIRHDHKTSHANAKIRSTSDYRRGLLTLATPSLPQPGRGTWVASRRGGDRLVVVGERIGDRTRPLADKTMGLIKAGLARYVQPELLVLMEGRDGKTVASAWEAMRTMTTRNETGPATAPARDRRL